MTSQPLITPPSSAKSSTGVGNLSSSSIVERSTPGSATRGILKRKLQQCLKNESSTLTHTPSKSVHFAPPSNLRHLLQSGNVTSLQIFLSNISTSSFQEFNNLSDTSSNQGSQQSRSSLIVWLQSLTDNIALLTPEPFEPFILTLLSAPWPLLICGNEYKNSSNEEKYDGNSDFGSCYIHFLSNLITSHHVYTKPVVLSLVKNFQRQTNCTQNGAADANLMTVEAIKSLINISPVHLPKQLLHYIAKCMPYMLISTNSINATDDATATSSHTTYFQNVATLIFELLRADAEGNNSKLFSTLRHSLLASLVERLVQLDAYLPRSDLVGGYAEEENMLASSTAKIAKTHLDEGMSITFQLVIRIINEIDMNSTSSDQTKSSRSQKFDEIWSQFLNIFEIYIFPSHETSHVQFLIFTLISHLDERIGEQQTNHTAEHTYASKFLEWLWHSKFVNLNTPVVYKQSAVYYMGSFVARSTCVDLHLAKVYMQKIVDWIHCFLKNSHETMVNDEFEKYSLSSKNINHFYATCQAVFYIFAFRHQEFWHSLKQNINFLLNLQFGKIITSKLNPLKYLLPSTLHLFTSLCRSFKLFYCDVIVTRNARLTMPTTPRWGASGGGGNSSLKEGLLPSFFPFDPYYLSTSKCYVMGHFYRHYDDGDDDFVVSDSIHHDDDEINGSSDFSKNGDKRERSLSCCSTEESGGGNNNSAMMKFVNDLMMKDVMYTLTN